MTINAFLQARTSSRRLPNKVLKPILGQPMLLRQIERIQDCQLINTLVVVTSNDTSDDAIEQLCIQHDIHCFRGSLDDVLDRFYQAHIAFPSDHIVRLTGDCPLIEPKIIDEVIKKHLSGNFDYTNNCTPPTFPDGLDAEVLSADTLKLLWQKSEQPADREHVTLFIDNNPTLFNCASIQHNQDLSDMRWTVDEPEDFKLIEKIYQLLFPKNAHFTWLDVLALLVEHPELAQINSGFTRNEGSKQLSKQDDSHHEN